MRIYLLLPFAFLCFLTALQAQDLSKLTDPIVQEGKRLYRSELASWHGTDLFLEAFSDREKIGGYFSYVEGEKATCIFFSRDEEPQVIGTMVFEEGHEVAEAKADLTERPFTELELEYYKIRTAALEEIRSNDLFVLYENMNFNIIPVISANEKKVYVLTGPEEHGVVVFGNDYLIAFKNDYTVKKSKQLHNNIIPMHYGDDSKGKEVAGSHSHLPETGDFITATDICTLMLYEEFANWEQHTVISKKYVSIWNCKTDQLVVLKKKAMDRILKDQQTRNK